jgi:hypothetical protein
MRIIFYIILKTYNIFSNLKLLFSLYSARASYREIASRGISLDDYTGRFYLNLQPSYLYKITKKQRCSNYYFVLAYDVLLAYRV